MALRLVNIKMTWALAKVQTPRLYLNFQFSRHRWCLITDFQHAPPGNSEVEVKEDFFKRHWFTEPGAI